jgi:hypothetical protein
VILLAAGALDRSAILTARPAPPPDRPKGQNPSYRLTVMETVGRGWDRLVGLLFLAIVVAAVALLVAGYGVAVGIGALAGLVLGFLAGAFGLLWLGRGSGRSITFGAGNGRPNPGGRRAS